MATVQRNVKTYGNRNFVGEVSSAPSNYAPILSNEVDADFDTIYAAWNGGADTVNIKDGSITYAKLAPDAQLWRDTGTSLTPGTNFAARPILAFPGDATGATVLLGSATAKARVLSLNTQPGSLGLFSNRNWAAANAQDDATKVSWAAILNIAADQFLLQRAPAGSTTQTNLLTLDATGQLTLPTNGACNPVIFGALQAKGRLVQHPTAELAYFTCNASLSVGGVWAQDNGAKPSYLLIANVAGDQMNFQRIAAGTTTTTNLCTMGSTGDLTITGANATKAAGTAWIAASDRRTKQNITEYAAGLEQILALRPIRFEYNGLGGTQDGLVSYGFLADEVEPVMPEMVGTQLRKLNPDDDDEIDLQTLDTTALPLALVRAVQELAARVATLEAA